MNSLIAAKGTATILHRLTDTNTIYNYKYKYFNSCPTINYIKNEKRKAILGIIRGYIEQGLKNNKKKMEFITNTGDLHSGYDSRKIKNLVEMVYGRIFGEKFIGKVFAFSKTIVLQRDEISVRTKEYQTTINKPGYYINTCYFSIKFGGGNTGHAICGIQNNLFKNGENGVYDSNGQWIKCDWTKPGPLKSLISSLEHFYRKPVEKLSFFITYIKEGKLPRNLYSINVPNEPTLNEPPRPKTPNRPNVRIKTIQNLLENAKTLNNFKNLISRVREPSNENTYQMRIYDLQKIFQKVSDTSSTKEDFLQKVEALIKNAKNKGKITVPHNISKSLSVTRDPKYNFSLNREGHLRRLKNLFKPVVRPKTPNHINVNNLPNKINKLIEEAINYNKAHYGSNTSNKIQPGAEVYRNSSGVYHKTKPNTGNYNFIKVRIKRTNQVPLTRLPRNLNTNRLIQNYVNRFSHGNRSKLFENLKLESNSVKSNARIKKILSERTLPPLVFKKRVPNAPRSPGTPNR
jgi:hypothetical protein